MSYSVYFSPEAQNDLDDAPSHVRPRILEQVKRLADDPRPAKGKELRVPLDHLWRIRVGEWRIIYQIDDALQEVWIARVIRKRGSESYRELE